MSDSRKSSRFSFFTRYSHSLPISEKLKIAAAADNEEDVNECLRSLSMEEKLILLKQACLFNIPLLFNLIYQGLSKAEKISMLDQHDFLAVAAGDLQEEIVDIILDPLDEAEKNLYITKKPNSNSTCQQSPIYAVELLLSSTEKHEKALALFKVLYNSLQTAVKITVVQEMQNRKTFDLGIDLIKILLEPLTEAEQKPILQKLCRMLVKIPAHSKTFIYLYEITPADTKREMIFPEDSNVKSILKDLRVISDIEMCHSILDSLSSEEKGKAYAILSKYLLLRVAIVKNITDDLTRIVGMENIKLNQIILGDTPLTFAVIQNRIEAVKTLCIQKDVDVNLQDSAGCTPLLQAVLTENSEILAYLCSLDNVNLYMPDAKGMTALDYARIIKFTEGILILETAVKNKKPSNEDLKLIDKVSYVTRLAHEIGISKMSLTISHGKDSVDVEQSVANFVIKSLPALAEDLRMIYQPSVEEKAEDKNHETILEAVSANADYYANNGKSTIEALFARYQANKMVMISSGWLRHGIALVFYNDLLILSNRGQGMNDGAGGLVIYKIDPTKVTKEYLEGCTYKESRSNVFPIILSADMEKKNIESKDSMIQHIKSIFFPSPEALPITVFNVKSQNHGTCTFVNPKSAIEVMLYILKQEELSEQIDAESAEKLARRYARNDYKLTTKKLRDNAITGLIKKMNYPDQSNEDKLFYLDLSITILEKLGTYKNYYHKDKMARVALLLKALNVNYVMISQDHSIMTSLSTRFIDILIHYAGYPFEEAYTLVIPMLRTVIDDSNRYNIKNQLMSMPLLLNNIIHYGIELADRDADRNLKFASEFINGGRELDVAALIKTYLESGDFNKAEILMHLSINVAKPSELLSGVENCTWDILKKLIQQESNRKGSLANTQQNQYYVSAYTYPNYTKYCILRRKFEKLPPLSVAKLVLRHFASNLYHEPIKSDLLCELKSAVQSDVESAHLSPELHADVLRHWATICCYGSNTTAAFLPILATLSTTESNLLVLIEANIKYIKLLSLYDKWTNKEWNEVINLIKEGVDTSIRFNNRCSGEEYKYLLPEASRQGMLHIVKLLIEHGADVNLSSNRTALQESVIIGDVEVTRYLIENGAEKSVIDINGNTLLHLANDEETAKLIIDGINVNSLNSQNETAVFLAVKNQKPKLVEVLLMHSADANLSNIYNKFPIHVAVKNNDLKCLQLLVQYNANIDEEYGSSGSTLNLAVTANHFHPETVLFLLKNGANEELIDFQLNNLLHKSIEDKKDESKESDFDDDKNAESFNLMRFLVEEIGVNVDARDSSNNTPLIIAVKNKQYNKAKYLLELGADANARNKYGDTALSIAAFNGNFEFVKYLVDQIGVTVQPNINNNKIINPGAPLCSAAYRGHVDIVKYLIKIGADVNLKDRNGETALMNALAKGAWSKRHTAVAEVLIKNGAKINEKDGTKNTIIHLLAKYSTTDHVKKYVLDDTKYLLELGGNVNAKNADGNTPLHEAAKRGNIDMVVLLISKKAEVNATNKNLNTALHLAVEKGHLEVVQYLIEKASAKLNLKNSEGKTALELSVESKNNNVADYINALLAQQVQQQTATITKIGSFAQVVASENEAAVDSNSIKLSSKR